jgi:hypothetical protein
MALHTPKDFMMQPCDCHVCGQLVSEEHYGIEHSGSGQYVLDKKVGQGYVSIWLHPECATVLMLRLANDVMRVKRADGRVVDVLQNHARNKNFCEE